MSVISTVANYGGIISDTAQNIKQFYVGSKKTAQMIYKTVNNLKVLTPSDNKYPVLINNDLIVTGSLYNSSDKRLKNNVTDISEKNLDDIFTLNPIIFTYKTDKNNKIHYGLIAQDVEILFPELVENNNLGYKSVNYNEFIPLILAKMKKMQEEIDLIKAAQ